MPDQERVTLWRPLMPATGKSYNDRWYQPLDSDHERTLREYPKYYEVRTFTPESESEELREALRKIERVTSGTDRFAQHIARQALATPVPREEGDADDSAKPETGEHPNVTEGPSCTYEVTVHGPNLYCDKCGERREPDEADYVCRKGGRSLPEPKGVPHDQCPIVYDEPEPDSEVGSVTAPRTEVVPISREKSGTSRDASDLAAEPPERCPNCGSRARTSPGEPRSPNDWANCPDPFHSTGEGRDGQ